MFFKKNGNLIHSTNHYQQERASLTDLRIGQIAEIIQIDCSSQLKRRLMDMGLTQGTPVQVTRHAPLGDPIEIELRGYRLSIRKEDANKILVKRRNDKHD